MVEVIPCPGATTSGSSRSLFGEIGFWKAPCVIGGKQLAVSSLKLIVFLSSNEPTPMTLNAISGLPTLLAQRLLAATATEIKFFAANIQIRHMF
jgi:hypothetical protein